jgi:hypothetical protein
MSQEQLFQIKQKNFQLSKEKGMSIKTHESIRKFIIFWYATNIGGSILIETTFKEDHEDYILCEEKKYLKKRIVGHIYNLFTGEIYNEYQSDK